MRFGINKRWLSIILLLACYIGCSQKENKVITILGNGAGSFIIGTNIYDANALHERLVRMEIKGGHQSVRFLAKPNELALQLTYRTNSMTFMSCLDHVDGPRVVPVEVYLTETNLNLLGTNTTLEEIVTVLGKAPENVWGYKVVIICADNCSMERLYLIIEEFINTKRVQGPFLKLSSVSDLAPTGSHRESKK
jgi:hypothetical protein